MHRSAFRAAGAAVALGLVLTPVPSASQDTSKNPVTAEAGLYRDSHGRLWCGGTCNHDLGQVCCTITYPS
jgi:hypothetical protein